MEIDGRRTQETQDLLLDKGQRYCKTKNTVVIKSSLCSKRDSTVYGASLRKVLGTCVF